MIFYFKKFSIRQEKSAMKVGTDGLLLATSTPLSKGEKSVLDIGTGTGLISLIIAQRDPQAQITALEIDEAAANEASFNFKASPFNSRLEAQHINFTEYSLASEKATYDLIICNPPFFDGSQAKGSRTQARNSANLPAESLLEGVNKLLKADGQFSLIIPYQNEQSFIALARKHGLFPAEVLRIRGRKESKLIRSIIHFLKVKSKLIEQELYIEVDQRHQYSDKYIELTKDFLTIFD